MRVVVVVAAVLATVMAGSPRERRQAEEEECQWFEPCYQGEAPAGTAAVPKDSSGQGRAQSQHQPCSDGLCVPYYLCREGNIITDGAGLIDIRIRGQIGSRSSSECSQFLDVCCSAPTTSPVDPEPQYLPKCGVRNDQGLGVRIQSFTNNQAQFGEFPWMAAVLRKEVIVDKTVKLYVCGGSLIHPSVVLTAAHCVGNWGAGDLTVRLGEWDTQRRNYERLPHQDIDVNRIVVHPKYQSGPLFNNLALIFLQSPAILSQHIDTICLSTDYSGSNCWVTGWGTDKFGKDGEYQNVLKKIELNTWTNRNCQTALRKTRLGIFFRLDKSFVCAGGLTGQDACKGDGGSPLVCPRADGRYTQVGIVAWGIGCGVENVPGVYADTQYAHQWIINTTEEMLVEMGRYTENYWN